MKKLLIALSAVLLFSCGLEKETGTISVNGTGDVIVSPDTAQLRISVTEKGQTTKEAQNMSNAKIGEVLTGLKSAGIEDNNIQTSAITFSNDNLWNPETRRNEIAGQIVSQSVTVKFENLDESPDFLASVLDTLGTIDGIGIGNLSFSIDDPQPLYIEARRLAYEKAKQKAEELAEYAGMKLGKAMSISEGGAGPAPYMGNVMLQRNIAVLDSGTGAPSEVPGGEISISYNISVVFETH
jgi:uncharacterized protein